MRKVLTYVRLNLDGDLTLTEVARVIQRSRSYFARAFSAASGQSFHRYVIDQRLARAQSLMLHTDLSLAVIALECGFADQAHLTRLFRRTMSETPCRWRSRRRPSAPVARRQAG